MDRQAPDIRLDEASLLESAVERAGYDHFGDEDFRVHLRALLGFMEKEGRLNDVGRATQRERLVGLLANRLSCQFWFDRHPEIENEEIDDPIVIVGLPRTGTTMLHRTIASESRVFGLLWWESRYPGPLPGWSPERARTQPDPRIASAKIEVQQMLEANPELAAVHPFEAESPDEEIMLLEHTFMSGNPPAFMNLPSYFTWLETHDNSPAYAYMKKLLKFLQWQKKQRGESADRWVLKTPHHLMHLDLVFEHFPEATVIQTHRDTVETIPSFASMNYEIRLMASDQVNAEETGRQWFDRMARAMAHCLAIRDRMPADRFIDIDYRDAIADPIAQVRRIYDSVGMELTPEAEGDMLDWAARNRRDLRPSHEYSLEGFGFDASELKDAFADYRARFIET